MDMELSFGTHLLSQDEQMTSITMTDLYTMIRQKDSSLASQQAVLRSILSIDAQKYRNLKKNLPYFVCGKFVTGRRKMDEFTSTSGFVIDIDHYNHPNKTLDELKEELAVDNRIALLYTSPSGNGLKILFILDMPCQDANIYAAFYRQFAMSFAKEHDITNFVDYKTNDVTRACFLAHDPNCRINPNATTISIDKYVNLNNVDMFLNNDRLLDSTCNDLTYQEEVDCETTKSVDPNEETLKHIRDILTVNKRKRTQKEDTMFIVPTEIKNIMDGLRALIDEAGVELYETRGIQYGIKLMLRTTLLQAEINVFYGKRGYSVVLSPKKGTSKQLGCMMQELVSDYLYGLTA